MAGARSNSSGGFDVFDPDAAAKKSASRARSSALAIQAQADFSGAVRALEQFERQGLSALDETMKSIADRTASDARGRGGDKYGEIRVAKSGHAEYAVVAMQNDGRHVANYHNYGTLASRRPKPKRPGTKRDRSQPGIKRKRFVRKPPKKVIIELVIEAVIDAGRRAGLDMKRGV